MKGIYRNHLLSCKICWENQVEATEIPFSPELLKSVSITTTESTCIALRSARDHRSSPTARVALVLAFQLLLKLYLNKEKI